MVYCPECGKENPDDANFCTQCGTELPLTIAKWPPAPLAEKPEEMKKGGGKGKWIAVVIIILGIFGFFGYQFHQFDTQTTAFDALEVGIAGVGTPTVGTTRANIPVSIKYTNPTGYDSPEFRVSYDVLWFLAC